MSTEQINRLHEQASERYLNGDYQGALEAWRNVLSLDAANEQALEGVHLASQFVDPGPQAPAGATPNVERDLEEGLKVLDGLRPTALLDHEMADGTTDLKPRPPGEETSPAAEKTLEGWEPTPATSTEPDAFGLEPVAGPAPGESASVSAAASELRRRVEDLLAQAKAKTEAGDRDEALAILSRLAILDEENVDASALRAKIEAQSASDLDKIELAIIEGVAALEAGNLDEAERCLNDALKLAPDHREARHYLEKVAERRASGGEDLLGAAVGESAPHEDAVQRAIGAEAAPPPPTAASKPIRAAATDAPEPPEPPPARSGPRFTLPPKRVLVLAGAGAAALVCAAIALPHLFGGAAPKLPAPNAPTPKTVASKIVVPHASAASRRPAAPVASTKPGPVPTTEATAPVPTVPADPVERAKAAASSLATGRSLMASGDFGGAVVAFHETLTFDPENAEAKAGFAEAGERYKASKAERDALNNIKLAFRDGEYTSGLRLAYRLPPTVSASYVEGVKVVGWYNLAIVALRAGDCREALSHLDEALQVAPADAETKKLKEFASHYVDAVKDRVFLDHVEALAFRPLPAS